MEADAEAPLPIAPDPDPLLAARVDHLWERLGWLVRLRWLALLGVVFVLAVAWRLGAVVNEVPLAGVAGLLLVANFGFARWRAQDRREQGLEALERHATLQLLVDIVALVGLLHWSDGVENPFAMFFAFLAAIAGKILPVRKAFLVAGAAVAIHGGVVLAEHAGVLAHHPLFVAEEAEGPDPFIESGTYLSGYLVAFALTVFGTVYFVSSATRRFQAELAARSRVERVAASRARLAQLGELSAGVAHSIRNPLHGVLNCVDLLRMQTQGSPAAADTLELMEEGLRRIETLTQRLLTLTRDAPLQRRPTDLGDLAEETIRLLGARGGPERPALERDAGAPLVADVDPDRLCEALANVIHNAVDACRGGGRVTVRVAATEGAVVVEVRDTGEGIPADVLPHVFDAFYTTKPVGEGTGLGLAITRRVVEEHGGRVGIESGATGTCVRFELPRDGLAPNVQTMAS